MSSATVPLDQISDLLKLRFDRTLEFINKSEFKPKKQHVRYLSVIQKYQAKLV